MLRNILGLIVGVFMCGMPALLKAQSAGTVSGVVRDASTKETLPFATVVIQENQKGTTTDHNGRYLLTFPRQGKYTLVISYMGYDPATKEVEVLSKGNVSLNVSLVSSDHILQEIEITAQAQGQAAAINQQINSNTIVNVVSRDKIQDLPDQNAAEAVGRLPGVAVQRSGGEATKVAVRGLSPRFNSITVNGERLPGASDNDRSVDLSLISPDQLQGIEVFKALTPDRDADAVGGSVNFVTRNAESGFSGDLRLETGYNSQVGEFGQYRGNIGLDDRFFDDKLGILWTANFQRANRSSQFFNSAWDVGSEGVNGGDLETIIVDLNLGDIYETRDRYGSSFNIDYRFNDRHEVILNTGINFLDRDELRRRRRYRVENAYQEYDIRHRIINETLLSNTLRGTHQFGNLNLFWRGSYISSTASNPQHIRSRFRETGAFFGSFDQTDLNSIPPDARNNFGDAFLLSSEFEDIDAKETNTTFQFDLTYDLPSTGNFNGYLKAGGKIRDNRKEVDVSVLSSRPIGVGTDVDSVAKATGEFLVDDNDRILMANFLDPFELESFLNGSFVFEPWISNQASRDFAFRFRDYFLANPEFDLQDYFASETIYSTYAMTELHFKRKLMIMGGVRLEHTVTSYQGRSGIPRVRDGFEPSIDFQDTVGTNSYTEILPMVHLRYKVTDWFDIRVAATKSLSRPIYTNLVPFLKVVPFDNIVERGDPNLLHTSVWNYDLFLSFYNKYGLFTIGAFYKELENIDFLRRTISTDQATPSFIETRPENAPGISTVQGVEVDLQTNMNFMPGVLKGMLVSLNMAFISSETFYPTFNTFRNPDPPFDLVVEEGTRPGPVIGQPDFVANATLGYEKGGFSWRLSMQTQRRIFLAVGSAPPVDIFGEPFVRWDMSVSQKVTKKLRVTWNFNNISNMPEIGAVGNKISEERFFGWTTDLGLRYKF